MAWKGSLEGSWKRRTHRRFASEAEQKCVKLSQDYEIKLAELRDRLRSAEEKCALVEESQTRTYENMKSALMRGVCALNMETMSVLKPESGDGVVDLDLSQDEVDSRLCVDDARQGRTEDSWPRSAPLDGTYAERDFSVRSIC